MQQISKSYFGSILLLTAISLGTLFFGLGSLPLSGNDEPRYARIAEEMHDRGDWVTPTLEGIPWLEKPPLYYWITIPFYSLFESKETAARFGPALCALITALAIFWLGTTLRNRVSGLLGAAMLLTSFGFIAFGRSASTDMPFTCCLTLGLAILASAVKKDPGTMKVLAAYALLGLAVLGKGPVAIILATGIGLIYWYLNEHGNILSRWRIVRGSLILLLVCVPWFWLAFKENGYAFVTTFFVNHNIARYVTEIHHHSEPFYFYFYVLLGLLFHWSSWLPFLITKSPLKEIRRWRDWDPGILFLTCWFIFPILFFSLSNSKLLGYILPSLPPLSLLLGIRISQWMEQSVRTITLRISMAISLVFSLTAAVAAPIYFQNLYGGNWKTGLILSPFLLIPSIVAAFFGFRGHCGKAFSVTVLHGLLIIFAVVQFAVPVLENYFSSRNMAQFSLEVRKTGEPIVTYRDTNHSLNYYTGYRVHSNMDNPELMRRYSVKHESFLVVSEEKRVWEFENLESVSIVPVGKQGDLRLFRLSEKKGHPVRN